MLDPLFLVRVLRRLPHTSRFEAHLNACAALEILYAPFDENFPRLRWAHVLRIVPLPDLSPGCTNMVGEGVEWEHPDDIDAGRETPDVFDKSFAVLGGGSHTLH